MNTFRKKIYVTGGHTTVFFGKGRKEFDLSKPLPEFETYLTETAQGTCAQVKHPEFDEGVIGSFMPGRFINQANIPGFLPYMVPTLLGKPCTGIEGACGTGGRTIATGVKSVLSDLADSVFVAGFEIQNSMKAVYGADVLAGASYYKNERKAGHAYFFPGIFAERAGAYFSKYGEEETRKGMAKWYENAILNARKNPKAQEYHNTSPDLFSLGMTKPNPDRFIPYLNHYDCSKVSDGAASLVIASEEGLLKLGADKRDCVEIVGMGAAEGDITKAPEDLTVFSITEIAVQKALEQAGVTIQDIGLLELHDCFTITGLLALEALELAPRGKSAAFVLEGNTSIDGTIPTNLSGGLGGFGHPTGATGVRQMADLQKQLTGKADNQAQIKKPYALMISMGGNDKTVTCFVVKSVE